MLRSRGIADTKGDWTSNVNTGAPVWSGLPAGINVLDNAQIGDTVLNLASYCSDPDGDTITYSQNVALPSWLELVGSEVKVATSLPAAGTNASASFDADDSIYDAEGDYQARATGAGVIQAMDFRESQIALYNKGVFPDGLAGDVSRDTSGVALTGGACLKINYPAARTSGSGSFRFALNSAWNGNNWDQVNTWGMGNTAFYVQYRLRVPWSYIHQTVYGSPNQKKQNIISTTWHSMTAFEHVLNMSSDDAFIYSYHQDGSQALGFQESVGGGIWDKQNAYKDGVTRLCAWNDIGPGPATCYRYVPDVWMCLMMRVHVATYSGTTGNEWDLWAWTPGETTVRSDAILGSTRFSHICSHRDYLVGSLGSYTGGFNGIHLLLYTTNRTGADSDTHAFYDQLIVSTQPIACPTI